MITIQDILDQAKNTANILEVTDTNSLWEFVYSTYRAVDEEGDTLPFTLFDLEKAFNDQNQSSST